MVILPENIAAINKYRNDWMELLMDQGISTRPATHAVHMLSFYSEKYKIKPEDFPNAFKAHECSISFPLFHGMTREEKNRVIEIVLDTANAVFA